MATMILRPNALLTKSTIMPEPWASASDIGGSAYTNLADGSDGTTTSMVGEPSSITRASLYGFTNASLPSDAVIYSVELWHQVRVSVSTTLTFAYNNLDPAYELSLIWDSDIYGNGYIGPGVSMQELNQYPNGYVLTRMASFGPKGPATATRDSISATQIDNIMAMISTYKPHVGDSYTTYISEMWIVVNYQKRSTPAGIGPNALVSDATPVLTFQHDHPDDEAADAYRVRVIDVTKFPTGYSLDYNVFNDGYPARFLWDSGVVSQRLSKGQYFEVIPTVAGENSATYRAYIQTRVNGVWSQPTATGPYAYFSVASRQPAAPRLTVDVDNVNKAVRLSIVSSDNLATNDQANQESGAIGGWVPQTNTTVVPGSGVVKYDTTTGYAINVGSVAAGQQIFKLPYASAPTHAVTSGKVYSAVIRYIPGAGLTGTTGTETHSTIRIDIRWYNSAGSLISTTTGKEHSDVFGKWVMANTSAAAPFGAVRAEIYVYIQGATAAGEHHSFTDYGFWAGPVNYSSDPLLQKDVNGDGIPDSLTKYVFPDPELGISTVFSRDQDVNNVFAGQSSIKIVRPSGSTTQWVGLIENTYLAKGKRYTVHMWCRSNTLMAGVYANNGTFSGPVLRSVLNTIGDKHSFSFTQSSTTSVAQIIYRMAAAVSGTVTNAFDISWIDAVMIEPERDDASSLIAAAESNFETGFPAWNSAGGDLPSTFTLSTDSVGQVGANSLKAIAGAVHTKGYIELCDRASGSGTGLLGRAIVGFSPCHVFMAVKGATPAYAIVLMRWYDGSGVLIDNVSAAAHGSDGYFPYNDSYEFVTDGVLTSSVMQTLEGVVKQPTNAVYGQVIVRFYKYSSGNLISPATGDVFYIDEVYLKQNNQAFDDYKFEQYSYGGTFFNRKIQIQRANIGWTNYLDGLITWQEVTTLPDHSNNQNSEYDLKPFAFDFFLPQGLDHVSWYRVRTVAPDYNGSVTASDWSIIARGIYIDPVTKPTLFSTTDFTKNMQVVLSTRKLTKTVQKSRTVHQPIGRDKPIVVSGPVRAEQFELSFYCATEAEELALMAFLDRNEDFLLRLPLEERWLQLASDYQVTDYTKQNEVDPWDAIIVGTFQEIANPTL